MATYNFDPATLGEAQQYYVAPDVSEDAYWQAKGAADTARELITDPYSTQAAVEVPDNYEDWVKQQYQLAEGAARKAEDDAITGKLGQQLLAGWQGLGEEVGIGSSGTPQAEIGGRSLSMVAADFARKLREQGITDISQAKFNPGALAAWTAEGKGNVSLVATPDGRLVPVWGSSSDAGAARGAVLALALSFTGAGALIGSTITSSLGIAASAATNAMIGNVVVNTALNGGDIESAVKGAVASWAGAQVGGMVGNAAKTVFDSAEGIKLISNIANNATQAAIRGGDVESAILNTVVAGAVDFATAKIPDFDKLPSSVQGTIKQSINAAVQGKDIDAGAMLANAAKEGLLSYGLSQIPQFNEADARTQSFVTTMLRSAIDGGDLSDTAINWAVGQAKQELQKVFKAGPALDELKKAGIIKDASYFSLDDQQKELVDRLAQERDPKAAAARYINEQTTTPEEIRQFYKQITGKDATDAEAELLSTFTGMDEETAKVGLDNQIRANIAADELRFEQLNKIFTDPQTNDQDLINVMAEYNITPAFIEKLTGQKYDDIVRQLDARFMSQDEVTEAFRAAREAAGLEPRDPTPDEVLRYVGSNAGVISQIQADVDREATTFDASGYGSVREAMEAAKAQGYNNFIGPDGNSYMVHSPVVAIQAGAFDGTTFGSVKAASDAAREAGKTTFIGPDEQHYMVLTPAQEGAIKDEIKQTRTFGQAFADARAKLGPGRTFEWTNPATGETKTYNTYAATELYDGSRAGSKVDAAILAAQNGKTMFQYDGKIWSIPPGSLDNVGTQSRAEARRLVEANATAISNEQAAALESKLQTPRLGDLDTVGGKIANLFGMSMQGLGQQVQMFADAYSAITGTPYGNSYYKIGQAMQGIGDSLTSRSLDRQTEAANRILAQGERANFLDQPAILARAIKENPGWFGSETFKETVQEVAPWAATLLGYGAATAAGVAAAPAMLIGLGAGAVTDGLEVFGSGAREAYDILKRAGVPEAEARSAAFRNGVMQALIVMPSEFIADKALFKSFFDQMSGGVRAWAMQGLSATAQQALAEYIETVGQGLSTKVNTLDREMNVGDLRQINMQAVFATSLAGSTTSSMIAGSSIQNAAVVAKDKLGNDVTLQELLNGSRDIDLNTVNPNAVIASGTNGQPVRLGTLSAIALQEGFTPATLRETLPTSFTTDNNIILNRDALGNDITLGDVFSGAVAPEQARTVIQDYVDLGLTAKTPVSRVISVDTANKTAVVQDQSGQTQTVTLGSNVKVGDSVNVDPNTNTAVLTGAPTAAGPVNASPEQQAAATQAGLTLPDNWGAFTARQKVDWFNANNVTPEQLKSAGSSDSDILWMKSQGYNVPASTPPSGSAATAGGVPATTPDASATPGTPATPGVPLSPATAGSGTAAASGTTPGASDALTTTGGPATTGGTPATTGGTAAAAGTAVTSSSGGQAADTTTLDTGTTTPQTQVVPPTPQEMATKVGLALPTDWDSRTTRQKIQWFNDERITPAQLKAAGVPDQDIQWMQQNEYNSGQAATAGSSTTGGQGAAVVAGDQVVNTGSGITVDTGTGVASNPNTGTAVDTNTGVVSNAGTNTVVNTNTGAATNVSTATQPTPQEMANKIGETLPQDWNQKNANEKIEWFNQNNVTPNELAQAGVSAADIQWMQQNGYTGGVQANNNAVTDAATNADANAAANANTNVATNANANTAANANTNVATNTAVNTNVATNTNIEDPRVQQLQTRINDLVQAGLTQTAATNAALSEMTGQLATLTQAQQAQQQAQQQAAQQQRVRSALDVLSPTVQPSATNVLPTVSPLQTSGQSKFVSPLAAFLATVGSQTYAQPKPRQEPTMTPQGQPTPDRYAYGKEPSIDELLDPYGENRKEPTFKTGGLAATPLTMGSGTRYGRFAAGGLNVVHHSGKARVDFRKGDAVTGPGDGQSDDIPAMLADGEFVFPADVVAALGNGSTKAGSDKLYDMMHSIRAHARSSGPKDLPPPAKSPLEYLKGAKQKSARRTT